MDLLPDQGKRVEPKAKHTNDPSSRTTIKCLRLLLQILSGIPCFSTEPGAHHYRLVGLEISAHAAVLNSYGLINFGNSGIL